ncbi:hypothetical protein C8R44DRAFT_871745 [Mycena epipterygia]|nr:hypothetical protein C8R44DRAFT_871745 [Mycena epipterygia]
MHGPGLATTDPLVISDDEEESDSIVWLETRHPAQPSPQLSQPSQPLIPTPTATQQTSIVGFMGSMKRQYALLAEDLMVNGVLVSGNRECANPIFSCTICLQLKSHPVSTACAHTFCFVCLRLAMEHSFRCPLCSTLILHPPHRVLDFEDILKVTFPDQADDTEVKWRTAWNGLAFPK